MKRSRLKQIIKEAISEAIVLRRYGDDILAVSDLEDKRDASRETFKSKNKLKNAGFKWDSTVGAWKAKGSDLKSIKNTIQGLNTNHPVIDTIENLPEFVREEGAEDRKSELSNKIDNYITSLISDVDNAVNSEEFAKFMAFNSKFRSYSINNTLLIYLQRPDAKKVAGFNKWKELHRRVKKGAKAISIFAPMTKKVEEKDLDSAVRERKYTFFRPVNVFDVSDTEPIDERGEVPELDWFDKNTPSETANKLVAAVTELIKNMDIDVTKDDSSHGEKGYSQGGKINISSDVEGVAHAATLIHEVAHELLHWKETSLFYIEPRPDRLMQELQAESVAYLVCKHYDLPVKQMANYLAMWKANKDAIMSQLTTLKKTADFIITEIDKLIEK